MVLEFFRGGADQELEGVAAAIRGMLGDNRHTFDLAVNALFGGTDAAAVGPEVRESDRRVNRAERQIRRDLVVHASVRGARADLPLTLASMSIVKDAERIGDYAKNIWDLADAGVNLAGAPDTDDLMAFRDRTSQSIAETARIFGERDSAAATELIERLDGILDEYDAGVVAQLEAVGPVQDAVARALLYRYLKRISAHLANILTSLVMPLDHLDYYDEDKAERI